MRLFGAWDRGAWKSLSPAAASSSLLRVPHESRFCYHRDSARLVRLPPGSYTAQASGTGTATGVALIEVYAAPNPPASSVVFQPVPGMELADPTPRTNPVALTQARPRSLLHAPYIFRRPLWFRRLKSRPNERSHANQSVRIPAALRSLCYLRSISWHVAA